MVGRYARPGMAVRSSTSWRTNSNAAPIGVPPLAPRSVQVAPFAGASAMWVRAWPLELVNGAPMDGHHAAERGRALREQVAPDQFAEVDPENFPSSTLPALALVSRAYEADPQLG